MENLLPTGTWLKNGMYQIGPLCKLGGQSLVYEGIDSRSDELIVIKQTRSDCDFAAAALEQEATILGNISHHSLPHVRDCFIERGKTFLIMSYVPGADLADLLQMRKVAFPHVQVLSWANQLLEILEYLQTREAAIVHRDINPRNIRLTPDGRIVLLDFGIAKSGFNKTLLSGGSAHYAPPEQLKDAGTDIRSDLYGLAATLYNMLTNLRPTDALSREAAILKGLSDPLQPVHTVNPEIPLQVSTAIERAMRLSPEARPQDVSDMKRDLFGWTAPFPDRPDSGVVALESETEETTRVMARSRPRLVVPLEASAGHVTGTEASKVIMLLKNREEIEPEAAEVIVSMLDADPQRRGSILHKFSPLFPERGLKYEPVARLIRQLVMLQSLDPDTEQLLRSEIGKYLADRTLSTIQPQQETHDPATQLQKETEERLQNRQLAERRSKEVLLWITRGALLGILIQVITALIYRSTPLMLLIGSNIIAWVIFHFAVGAFGVTLFIATLRMNSHTIKSTRHPSRVLTCMLGLFVAMLTVDDLIYLVELFLD